MIPDYNVITFTCVVALFTLVVAIAYVFLVNKFNLSISSNTDLKSSNDNLSDELVSVKVEVYAARL